MATRSTTLGRQATAPRGNRFEAFAWRYMRWSGVLLIPLVFGHLAIMHIINSVYVIDYEWVITERMANWLWRAYDVFMLVFAGLHGYNGLRYVINDYVQHPSWRRGLYLLTILVMVVVFVMGSISLLFAPFEPVALPESARFLFRV
jgi:succinate dehydrogenase / fumarate reductase membrane anchor subunit